jgi:hypothetical protein
MTLGSRTLVVYGASPRADAALRALVAAASDHDGRLTVVAMVAQEPESNRCCDMRSVLWNGRGARAIPIGALGRRRLHRTSPVPVVENIAELSAAPASAARV